MQDQPRPTVNWAAAPSPEVRAYAVMHTLRALELLAKSPYSSPELAESMCIDTRSARRLLQRLAVEGFVVQGGPPRRRYRATLRLAALGRQVLAHAVLPRLAAPRILELARATEATAHLWIPSQPKTLCVVHAERPGGAEPGVTIGAFAGDDHGAAEAAFTSTTRAERSGMYSHEGHMGTAAAVVFDAGRPTAAVGITGDVEPAALPAVVRAADELTHALARAIANTRSGTLAASDDS